MSKPLFSGVWTRWDYWWFRIFNKGLAVTPLKGHKPLFSERYGRRKVWHGLGHCWEVLS